MNVALLIIDVQEAFLGRRRAGKSYNYTLFNINETAKLFRNVGKPVVIVRDISEGNDESYQNVKELSVEESDFEVLKTFNNGFWQTNLDTVLKSRKIDYVVICGNAAEYCVLSTYNGALERGYGASLLQNGIFAERENGLLDCFYNRSLISHEVIAYLLKTK